jgi:hypothetical protein
MAFAFCPNCGQASQPAWKVCPHCGGALVAGPASGSFSPPRSTAVADPPVVRLNCPACGGKLALPTAGTEYVTCSYCENSLWLRRESQGYSLQVVERLGRAVGAEVGRQVVGEVGQQVRQEIRQEYRRAQDEDRRAKAEARRRRALVRDYNEYLGYFVGCLAGYGILLGFLPSLATGYIGLMLLAGAVLMAIITVALDCKAGQSLAASLLRVGVVGGLVLGLEYAIIWYFTVHLASQGSALFQFGPVPTRTLGR